MCRSDTHIRDGYFDPGNKKPDLTIGFFVNKCLAVSYFHMGRPHTIIGAKRFHF